MFESKECLVNVKVRGVEGIKFNNNFVFLNIKYFMGYIVGWDCVNRLC